MNRSFYTAVSAMMVGTKQLNDVSNNIVNVSTTGYKKDTSVVTQFADILINKVDENINIGNMNNQVYVYDTFIDFSSGSLVQTNKETDFAIVGDGFFKVEKDGKYMYTRSGAFNYDAEGYLVTLDGGFVMDKNNVRINKNTLEGNIEDNIQLVDFEDRQTLAKTKDNYFENVFNLSDEYQIQNTNIEKGFVEASNVDVSEEMANLIKQQRFFQLNQRSFSVTDELFEQISKF